MNYSTQQLNEIQRLASLFATIEDIAVMIDVDPDGLKDDIKCDDDAKKAYQLGKTNRMLELREIEIEQAKLGSTVAIDLIQKYITKQQLSEE